MGATAIPTLYALHKLAGGGASNDGSGFGADFTARLKAAAASTVPAPASAAPSPSAYADARTARDAATLARRRAASLTGRSGTLLTGGAGLVNEPVGAPPMLGGV